jgi:hypothetical protein
MKWDATSIIVGIPEKVLQEDPELLKIYLEQKYTAEMLMRLVTLDKGLSGDAASAKHYLELAAQNPIELEFDE